MNGSGVPLRSIAARHPGASENMSEYAGRSKPALPSTAYLLGPGNSALPAGTAAGSGPLIMSDAARTSPSTRRSVAPNRLRANPTPDVPSLTWTVVASSLRLSASSMSRRRAAVSATTIAG